MAKRAQRIAAILLGLAAAVMIVCVIIRSVSARREAAVALAPAAPAAAEHYGMIDLNTATEAELCELPGIGPTLAERMVRWRGENGGFHGRDDVLAVEGIGVKTFEKIEPYITY